MGSSHSALARELTTAVGDSKEHVAFPSNPLYHAAYVKPYNTTIPVTPAAITYPTTKNQVAAIVKIAKDNGVKVQPRCGGHSYANYSLGGTDGAVVVDLKHFQHFSMNRQTWRATVGAGTLLGDLTKRMHDAGNRAMAHGVCPQVGIGGHATIGGLGPSSRMWGAALDHVEEVEVVLADASIVRASRTQHPDVFWAIKGAGASFGIVTEFIVRTEAEPDEGVQYSYSFSVGSWREMAENFKAWQHFVSDPNLTRKFASQCILTEAGMEISGTFYGTKDEYDAFDVEKKFPRAYSAKSVVLKDYLGLVGHWAEEIGLRLGGAIPNAFYSKTLTFNGADLIEDDVVDKFFAYIDKAEKGTLLWFAIFDLAGGAINDVAQDATAYAHRDALFYLQTYAIGVGNVSQKTKDFLTGINTTIKAACDPLNLGAYPGYVDPLLTNPQREYWRTNLPRLEQIKRQIDPSDVFHNPQSVRPMGSKAILQDGPERKLGKVKSLLKKRA